MPTRRQYRVNALLREELQLLIPGRVDDPRLIGASVTRVQTTQDLSTAKVFVTATGDEAEADAMMAALSRASGFIRSQLGNLGLRRVPELVFARDRQYESGQRVLDILAQLEIEPEAGRPAGIEAGARASALSDRAGDATDDADRGAPSPTRAEAGRSERPSRSTRVSNDTTNTDADD